MIRLGKKIIKKNSNPYIIAEIGVNHEGSIEIAKLQIKLAKEGGADAVKFQSYKAEKLASVNSPAYWDTNLEKTQNQFQLFQKYDSFDEKDYIYLSKYCRELNIEFLSTPFDHEAVDYLDPIVSFFKVASADITNLPLLKKIASKSKPILLSTGASNIDEIREAKDVLQAHGCTEVALLHCILNYPTNDNNANLSMINSLKSEFPEQIIGYSDHTLPSKNSEVLKYAYILGATIIEKHFTHDKSLKGNDHYHAMDKHDLQRFIEEISLIKSILGDYDIKQSIPTEKISRLNARRSIVLKRSKRKGDNVLYDDLICKRPGSGISPIYIDKIYNKKFTKNLKADHILLWEDIE